MFEFGINLASWKSTAYKAEQLMEALGPIAPYVRWARLWCDATIDDPTLPANLALCQGFRACGVDVVLVHDFINCSPKGTTTVPKYTAWCQKFSHPLETGIRVHEVANEWDSAAEGYWTSGPALYSQVLEAGFNTLAPMGYGICAANCISTITNYDQLFAQPAGVKAHYLGWHNYVGGPAAKQSGDQQEMTYVNGKGFKVMKTENNFHETLSSASAPWTASNPTQWGKDVTTMIQNQRKLDGIFIYFPAVLPVPDNLHAGPAALLTPDLKPNQPFFNATFAGLST